MAAIINKLETVPEQRELFLWKFSDVSREEVNSLMKVTSTKFQNNYFEQHSHTADVFENNVLQPYYYLKYLFRRILWPEIQKRLVKWTRCTS